MSDILEEIQALQEQFSDLCEGRKEGESQEDFKARLFQEKLPTLKAKRRNLDKQIKDDEKEYKETNKAIEDNRKESEEVSKKSKEASEKTSKAFNDYIQAQAGTELSNKLYKKYDNAGKKKDKLDAKSNELFDTRMAMHDKKDDIADKGREKVDKRNELNHLVARNTDYDNRWKVTDRPSFNKEIEKMMKKYKDSNSYDEVISQIMDLKEAFTSLFEVEGLGDPASEIPPSTNKIKKDKKTKDGKVELVSVEDELFPYDGDAREQLRKKIIDKINGMIQGTATLEDLLQLVRQKQAKPVKEAIELIESTYDAIRKKYEKGTREYGNLMINAQNAQMKNFHQMDDDNMKKGLPAGTAADRAFGADTKEAKGKTKHYMKRHGHAPYPQDGSDVYEALKEAFELMEEIINEVSVKKWKEAAKNSVEGRKEAASDASDRFAETVYPFRPEVNDPGHKRADAWDKAEQRADRAEQLAKNLPNSDKPANKLKQAAKKVVDKRDKDNEEAVDTLQKGAEDYFVNGKNSDADRQELIKKQHDWVNKQTKENKARNLVGKPERRPEKDVTGKHKLKEQGYIDRSNEAFESAIELMEAIINEVSERTKIDAYKEKVRRSKAIQDASKKEAEWQMKAGGYKPAIDALKKADDAQGKEYRYRLRTLSHDKKFGQNAFDKANKELFDEWLANKNKVHEAIELMEAIISEISNETVSNALEKRIGDYWDSQAERRENPGRHEKVKKKLIKALELADKKADREGNVLYADIDSGIAGIYDPRNESLTLEGLFVNDGRGDLLKDIDDFFGSPIQKRWKKLLNTKIKFGTTKKVS